MKRCQFSVDAKTHATGGADILLATALFFLPLSLGAPSRAEEPAHRIIAEHGKAPDAASSEELEEAGFVSNLLCVGCHPDETALWKGSHHALAMQPASTQTVLGNFQNQRFNQHGESMLLTEERGVFRVRSEDETGSTLTGRIAYTFGVHPLQQYLVEFPGGRLQALTVAWDVDAQKWFSLYPDEAIAFDDALHWSGPYQTWNAMCAECHSTRFEKNYDPAQNAYSSTWAEINVSCQSCHGPGQSHVIWAGRKTQAMEKNGEDPGKGAAGLRVDLGGSGSTSEIETCAPCHSRRHPVSSSDSIGEPFLDHFVPSTLDAGLYWADGQILEEVYVYGSFLQSKMYTAGVRCSDCHEPHGLELVATGNALCTRCHGETPDPRFSQLKPRPYDDPRHHKHEQDSAGARCVGCHMPGRTYMGIDFRRDHSLKVPRPDLSHSLGVPDACSDCHDDRSPDWAARAASNWWGPPGERGSHWARALHDGRAGDPSALRDLLNLTQPGAAPDIVRATALSLAAPYGESARSTLKAAARDASPLMRITAASALSLLPGNERLPTLRPLLSDPLRSVRLEAGRGLATAPAQILGEEDLRLRDLALDEYVAAQLSMADFPSAHFNLAILDSESGRHEQAREAYEKALELDDRFLPALANWAQLESALGQKKVAEKILRRGLAKLPLEGELHYSLGLLLAEQGRFEEAAPALGQATSLLPGRARVQYNYGLAEQNIGASKKAEKAFIKASNLDPTETDFLRALAILYAQSNQWSKALPAAEQLLVLDPNAQEFRRLLAHIRDQLSTP